VKLALITIFYSRFSNYLIHFIGSKVLKFVIRKYKISKFAFIILELFPKVVTKENNCKLLRLEDFYLKSLLPNYNILIEAGSTFGYKYTEVTRIKMKTNYSIDRYIMIGNLNKGKKFSKNTIEKQREVALKQKPLIYFAKDIMDMKKI
jgi:group I intron endonuclease